MPELPEVEILTRHLAPLLRKKTIRAVEVRRARVIAPTSERELTQTLRGATFTSLTRRGKYLLFTLRRKNLSKPILLVGHLGMTGRMYLAPKRAAFPKHAAVIMDMGRHNFVYEDARFFGRLTLDSQSIAKLGPEPLGSELTVDYLAAELRDSTQSIKTKLLDQTLIAGIGNIYASEALFLARIPPRVAAGKLSAAQIGELLKAIRAVLEKAIQFGSKAALEFGGEPAGDGLFYYGDATGVEASESKRFLVYDRKGLPCVRCGNPIERIVQNARSTFFCPTCQRSASK